MKRVLYTAAHSGFDLGAIRALGGGGFRLSAPRRRMERGKNLSRWKFLGPSLLKSSAPQQKDLVHYSELQYAAFCRRFEKKLTEKILQYDPKEVVVLCNDVSEGPDFKTLAAKGYPIYTIYHVDVVDYFCRRFICVPG